MTTASYARWAFITLLAFLLTGCGHFWHHGGHHGRHHHRHSAVESPQSPPNTIHTSVHAPVAFHSPYFPVLINGVTLIPDGITTVLELPFSANFNKA